MNTIPQSIVLTKAEMYLAAITGINRRIDSIAGHFSNEGRFGASKVGIWDMDIDGAGAELAFHKYKKIFFAGVTGNFKEADALLNVQIRHSPRDSTKEKVSLIVRKNDNPDHFYVLVTGIMPTYTVIGFIFGRDAQKDIWIEDPNNKSPAWFVPINALENIDFLDCSSDMVKDISPV